MQLQNSNEMIPYEKLYDNGFECYYYVKNTFQIYGEANEGFQNPK